MRILVAGGPGCGKTTYAKKLGSQLGFPVRSTDDLVGRMSWSKESAEVAKWIDSPAPYIIEGVTIPRALRKWLASHPRPLAPCELVCYRAEPFVTLSPGQEAMRKGVISVWAEVAGELRRRGVRIEGIRG